jgi:hypothetical protein
MCDFDVGYTLKHMMYAVGVDKMGRWSSLPILIFSTEPN